MPDLLAPQPSSSRKTGFWSLQTEISQPHRVTGLCKQAEVPAELAAQRNILVKCPFAPDRRRAHHGRRILVAEAAACSAVRIDAEVFDVGRDEFELRRDFLFRINDEKVTRPSVATLEIAGLELCLLVLPREAHAIPPLADVRREAIAEQERLAAELHIRLVTDLAIEEQPVKV